MQAYFPWAAEPRDAPWGIISEAFGTGGLVGGGGEGSRLWGRGHKKFAAELGSVCHPKDTF